MSSSLRWNPAPPPSSCEECGLLPLCGGWDDDRRDRGCFERCKDCFSSTCDYTCVANPVLFVKSIEEVRGLGTLPQSLRPLGEEAALLPTYIPQIEHGSNRTRLLKEATVSVPLHRLCTFDKAGNLQLKFSSRAHLLASLRLSERTSIVITCVSKDRWIEALYESRRRVLPQLEKLALAAVTVPNFSFVRGSPRTNSIWNQTRIFRMIEEMSGAGLPVAPHLQAETSKDWDRLQQLFQRFPYARHACMEFQTGLNRQNPEHPGREVYKEHFRAFQASTGGRVHPIVLGGYREIGFFAEICRSFSIIDACAFVKTVNYQRADSSHGQRRRWRAANLPANSDLADLLQANINIDREFFFRKNGLAADGRPYDPWLLPAA